MIPYDGLHSAVYAINFVAGLVFTVAFAVEHFHAFAGVCPLYLRLDKSDWGVREDHLPVCNVLLIFHAIFQCAWPLALAWMYAVGAGICYHVCDNGCCCPTTATGGADLQQEEGSDGSADSASDSLNSGEAATAVRSGCCQHCCLRVMLLDFRASRRLSFRSGERRLFYGIAGLHICITIFFSIFLSSIIMGYATRCSIAKSSGASLRLYYGDSFGELRSSDPDIMDMMPHRLLTRRELCFRNPITLAAIASACCSYACNLGNTLIYLNRWVKGLDAVN